MLESTFKLGVLLMATNNTGNAFAGMNRSIDKVKEKLSDFQSRYTAFGKSTSNLFNIPNLGIVAGTGAFLKMGADLEQTNMSFEVMLGNADKAKTMLAQLAQFANATPFENKELIDNAKVLLNYGISAEKILPTLQMLGDISQGNKEKLGALTLAYGQSMSLGKLQGQDWKQMINAGFNPLKELQKMTGKTSEELQKMMSEGKIGGEMIEKAFKQATSEGGMFYKMMDKQSQTAAGKWSTAMGSMKQQLAEMSLQLMTIATGFLDKLIPAIDSVGRFTAAHQELTKNIMLTTIGLGDMYIGYRVFSFLRNGAMLAVSGIGQVVKVTRTLIALNKAQDLVSYYSALQKAGNLAPIPEGMMKVGKATRIATAVQWLYNTACLANPYIATAYGIAALGAAVYALSSSYSVATDGAKLYADAQKKAFEKTIDERAELAMLFEQLKKTNAGSEERIKLIGKFNKEHNNMLQGMGLEKASADELAKSYDNLVEKIKQKAMVEVMEEEIKNAYKEQLQAEQDKKEHQENLSGKNGFWKMIGAAGNSLMRGVSYESGDAAVDAYNEKEASSQARVNSLSQMYQQEKSRYEQPTTSNNTTQVHVTNNITVNGEVSDETKLKIAQSYDVDGLAKQISESQRQNNRGNYGNGN